MNKTMKKAMTLTLTAVLLSSSLSFTAYAAEETESKQVITTIFPEYDWVMNILGENPANIEVTMLLDSGVDLHSYQPTIPDMMKIVDSDLFIYVGGESDGWVEDALAQAQKDIRIINLVESLGDDAKEEELVEGLEEDDEEEEEEEDEDEEEEEGPEIDEHVWLSLRNAAKLVSVISSAIQELDPVNADLYAANTDTYLEALKELDAKYEEAISASEVQTVLFGDRFPFRYLMDDYGLSYYGAFSGCSAESEASFETIIFLAHKVDELGLPAVLTLENPKLHIAETVVENTEGKDASIYAMDSLQSTTASDVAEGKTYLGTMEQNLEVLKKALGQN